MAWPRLYGKACRAVGFPRDSSVEGFPENLRVGVLNLGEQDLDSWHRSPKILRIYCLFLHMDDHGKDSESCRMGLVSPKNQPQKERMRTFSPSPDSWEGEGWRLSSDTNGPWLTNHTCAMAPLRNPSQGVWGLWVVCMWS